MGDLGNKEIMAKNIKRLMDSDELMSSYDLAEGGGC